MVSICFIHLWWHWWPCLMPLGLLQNQQKKPFPNSLPLQLRNSMSFSVCDGGILTCFSHFYRPGQKASAKRKAGVLSDSDMCVAYILSTLCFRADIFVLVRLSTLRTFPPRRKKPLDPHLLQAPKNTGSCRQYPCWAIFFPVFDT